MNQIKKTIILLLAALCCVVSADAKRVNFGLSAGLNTTRFSLKGDKDAVSNNLGYQAAVSMDVNTSMVTISPEVRFSTCSFNVEDLSILGAEAKIRSSSIDIPVLVGYSIAAPLKLEVGPRFIILDKAKLKYGDSKHTLDGVRSNTGYVIGLKLNLAKQVWFGVRLNGQFSTPETDFTIDNGTNYRVRNHSFSFSLGYTL